MKCFVALVLIIGCITSLVQSQFTDPEYEFLSLASFRPSGWIKDQLNLQASGLAGHLADFWPFIANSTWIGGSKQDPFGLNERVPYWLNGQVALASLTQDPSMLSQVNQYVSYIVSHQQPDGWYGHPNGDPWPRFPLVLALLQHVDAFPSSPIPVLSSLRSFFAGLLNRLQMQPLTSWAQYRWQDLALACRQMSLVAPDMKPLLGNIATVLRKQGFAWGTFLTSSSFPRVPCTPGSGQETLATHGVNVGQGLKELAVRAMMGDNVTMTWMTLKQAMMNLDTYHGQASGMFSCSEHLAGKNPSQGTELCTVVETMYSLAVLFSQYGKVELADRWEKIAFNALPGTMDAVMWNHVYLTQSNNVFSGHVKDPIYVSDGPDSNIYGLEPNYGCCTANFPQGWPKFVSSSWMRVKNSTDLVVASLIPVQVKTPWANVSVVSQYPFDGHIEMLVRTANPLNIYVRIPCSASRLSMATTSLSSRRIALTPCTFQKISIPGSPIPFRVTLHLQLPVEFSPPQVPSSYVTVWRGPLLMSLVLPSNWTRLDSHPYNSSDWQIQPTAPWNIAINASSLPTIASTSVSKVPFASWNCPIAATAQGVFVASWNTTQGAASIPPASPIATPQGTPFNITLAPMGCTQVRITAFPWYK